jgi:hypothetical protein
VEQNTQLQLELAAREALVHQTLLQVRTGLCHLLLADQAHLLLLRLGLFLQVVEQVIVLEITVEVAAVAVAVAERNLQ